MTSVKFWQAGSAAAIVIGAALVLYFAGSASSLLGVRVAPGLPFRIVQVGETNTPTLYIGESNYLEWDTRPDNIQRYPGENIALCPTSAAPRLSRECIILYYYVPNTAQTQVFVPPYITPGMWNLVLTAWDQSDQLLNTVASSIPVQVQLRPGITPSPLPSPAASPTILPSPSPSSSPAAQQTSQFACMPAAQTVAVGATVTVQIDAAGGQSSASWYALDGTPDFGSGTSFTTSFAEPGDKIIAAVPTGSTNASQAAICSVTVTAAGT